MVYIIFLYIIMFSVDKSDASDYFIYTLCPKKRATILLWR